MNITHACSDIDYDLEDQRTPPATLSHRRTASAAAPPTFNHPTAKVARRPSAPGPVAEGFFGRDKKNTDNQVQLDGEGSSVSSVPVVGNSPPATTTARGANSTPAPPKRDKRNLLPKTKPTKVCVQFLSSTWVPSETAEVFQIEIIRST